MFKFFEISEYKETYDNKKQYWIDNGSISNYKIVKYRVQTRCESEPYEEGRYFPERADTPCPIVTKESGSERMEQSRSHKAEGGDLEDV